MADWIVHNVMCTDKFEWMIIARMYSKRDLVSTKKKKKLEKGLKGSLSG